MRAMAEAGQSLTLYPCTLTYLTGPETLLGTVLHDVAISLAGIVYIQLINPEVHVSLCECSAASDIRFLQPAYGSIETVKIAVMFYDIFREIGFCPMVFGSISDAVTVNYQTGMESFITSFLPIALTDISEVWANPGSLAGFAGASFYKAILDEEMIAICNELLRESNPEQDKELEKKLSSSFATMNFLTLGDIKTYRSDHFLPELFHRNGMVEMGHDKVDYLMEGAKQKIEQRIKSYRPPERSKEQQNLLNRFLPKACRY